MTSNQVLGYYGHHDPDFAARLGSSRRLGAEPRRARPLPQTERTVMVRDPAATMPRYRPRRPPTGPRLDPADRPDPDELARLRTRLAKRFRSNKFMRG
ncbi:MAG: hypothetical protein ACRDQU_20760 [Pseudonocardiaceae bacterium]